MDTSNVLETFIAVRLPTAAVEQVNQWADKCGLPRAKFYTVALFLGARSMAASLDFLPPDLQQELQQHSAGADNQMTPEVILQIITGNKNQVTTNDAAMTEIELIVNLPRDVLAQFDQALIAFGMTPSKSYSLAFAMGARIMANTLESNSVFRPEILAHFMDKEVPPGTFMKSVRPAALIKSVFPLMKSELKRRRRK